jgi:hypothetical protein
MSGMKREIPEWVTRGKTIRELIRELQSFEDQDQEVRISLDYGSTHCAVSLVGRLEGKYCGLMSAEDYYLNEWTAQGEGSAMSETAAPIERWREIVANQNAAGVESLLAEDVVFHSPIVDTAQVGKAVTQQYLAAAFAVFGQAGSFRYVREVVGERDAVLEFLVEIDGASVNGVDMIQWNDEGKIVEFKVMLRPLKALKVMHQKIAAILQGAT